MATTGYSGFYTGLDAKGRCAVAGVAANVGVGQSVAQTRTGLRLKAVAPTQTPQPARAPPAVPPHIFLKHPLELEVMSAAKLWQLAQHLQSMGGGTLPVLPSHRQELEEWVLKAQQILGATPGTQAAGAPSELGRAAQGGFRPDSVELKLPKGGNVREEFREARKLRQRQRQAALGGTPAAGQDDATHFTPTSWAIAGHFEEGLAAQRAEARLQRQRAVQHGLAGNGGVLPYPKGPCT
ncbi:unnamed protein product [Symbiodinium natans]|uniref:Uncharacterized protein n=1 Tax=Symbiodinium natans TaxID=878477 RepID=A0A812LVM0_9DINO|nr:unnamed protein product [Symbiodinium natans]